MLKTTYLGKLSGIKLYIHWSFWLLLIYMGVVSLGDGVGAALKSVGFVSLVFFCVFLHELGHAFAGRIYNVKTVDITLYPIGGLARMQMTREMSPVAELVIAACGPLVNLVIAIVLAMTMALRLSMNDVSDLNGLSLVQQLLVVNIALFVFNLLPVYPMDGGRILRAILSFFVVREKAVEWTARLGQVLAAGLALYGLFTWHLTLTIIFTIMFFACSAELFQARLRRAMAQNNGMGFGGGANSPMGGWPFPGAGPQTQEMWDAYPTGGHDGRSSSASGHSGDIVDAEQVRRVP